MPSGNVSTSEPPSPTTVTPNQNDQCSNKLAVSGIYVFQESLFNTEKRNSISIMSQMVATKLYMYLVFLFNLISLTGAT